VWSQWNSTDVVGISNSAGGALCTSSAVVRDPTAWNHFCIVNNAGTWTIYKNNQSIASGSGTCNINQASTAHYIGCAAGSSYFSDGNLAEFYFIDGQALTPSSFGQADPNNPNNWIPKAYSGTYGNNGFYLKFNDGTSATTLGYDRSGNGNNWTPSGISTTAGVTYDWMTDTPTNNYATLNPIVGNFAGTLADASLKFTSNATTAYSTTSVSSGKWWWEVTVSTVGGDPYIGMMDSTYIKGDNSWGSEFFAYRSNGQKYNGSAAAYGATYTSGDVLGFALDVDTGTIEVYKQTAGSGNFASQGVMFSSGVSGKTWRPAIYGGATATVAHFNAGQRPFNYVTQHGALPTGFKALCTKNLPTPSILNPKNHFDVKLHVGNAASQKVTSDFKPGLVWIKRRNISATHSLFDEIRGATVSLHSETTGGDDSSTSLNSLDADGFTLGNNANTNSSPDTFVDWLWKAGGAGVSNTDGSITSTVSANQTAGFSIGYYDATGANGTVGHGLGAVLAMLIIKNRYAANSWVVWHKSIANTEVLLLNHTNVKTTDTAAWNSTTPTSTVFSLGTGAAADTNQTNASANDHLFYAWAEIPGFSKFGSYVGNGNADGPYVHCGFRPRYVLVKAVSGGTGSWMIFDTVRNAYNVTGQMLYADGSAAEATAGEIDITANGFKLRNTSGSGNTSGWSYIFAAFAESPFGGSNVSPACAR